MLARGASPIKVLLINSLKRGFESQMDPVLRFGALRSKKEERVVLSPAPEARVAVRLPPLLVRHPPCRTKQDASSPCRRHKGERMERETIEGAVLPSIQRVVMFAVCAASVVGRDCREDNYRYSTL